MAASHANGSAFKWPGNTAGLFKFAQNAFSIRLQPDVKKMKQSSLDIDRTQGELF